MTLALPLPTALTGVQLAQAEGPTDPAPVIQAKVVNENAGKKILFDNTHGQTAGAADWVIDGGFSDFGNGLANRGYYVKELRKTTPLTLADLQGYDAFVIGEANIPYKASEQEAMIQYVQGGGSIFFIGDHYNADRNKNRWDASEVFNGYRRGAWTDPAKGMNAEERASQAMQGVTSSDWLGENFGIRFRYNSLGDVTADNIVPPAQTFGITNGVSTVAMHAGSTMAILDPKKAKGLVYLPKTNAAWPNAVDQGVYNGGGVEEGPYAAISKLGAGKAAFIGDSSPVEDATPKYLREENGRTKTTYDGFKEQDDATLLLNMVDWLTKKESYTSFDQAGIALDQPTPLLPIEDPAASTEPQPEPWAAPAAGYKWYDRSTFAPGSFGSANVAPATPTYSTVKQATLPNAEAFQLRIVADNLAPFSTVSGVNFGIYLAGGTQVGQMQNADGSWPTAYGYSSQFSLTADKNGHATKDVTVRVKPGTTGAANLRVRVGSTAVKTETVNIANVPAEPLPGDTVPVPALITLADARTKSPGTVVTVEGVVTTQPGSFGGQGFYLQDSTAGIYVFQTAAGYNVGDKIKISAALEVYNNELELIDPVALTKTGTADVPTPILANTITPETYGQLITLENVTIQDLVPTGTSGTFEFNAVKGDLVTRVRVDNRTGLSLSGFPYQNGQTVNVTGVSSVFKTVNQLKPRGLNDFTVPADTVAPTTEAVLSGTANANGYFNQDVTVTLNAGDNASGVKQTEYSTHEGIWNVYSGPFTISTEGTTTVRFLSRDNAGNAEEVKTITVNVDKTAPTTDASLSELAGAYGWFNKDVTVTLTGTDATSGVANTEVKVGNAEWAEYTTPITVGTEGSTVVEYRSTDKAGNAEQAKSFTVHIDKSAPVVTLTDSGRDVRNVAIDGTVTFDLTATDALSGILTEELFLDDKRIADNAQLSALDLGLGAHTVRAVVTDRAGNVTTVSYSFLIEADFRSTNALVDGFLASGDVKNQGIANSLHAKLDAAHSAFAKGHTDQAAKHLTQLQQTLATYQKAGNVSAAAAKALNDSVQYMLTNTVK
ncbi:endonuclease [Tumebacillus sp. DT12]|uniref:Endonuclease n=1 Tax=Tumebacillus lacus TaxID=2995335 RepID=A0ABT3X2Q7_9BACL|nr:endonuclease [Tumebacillus lacus]MCX7571190.1 endonuclease [Tumebacillus lacus]